MRTLPLVARLYLIALWSIAAILISSTLFNAAAPIGLSPLLLLWLLLFVLLDHFEVEFEVGDGNRALMTITDAAIIFLVAVSGPSGVLVTALGTYIVGTLRRHFWYRNLFNVAVRTITYLTTLAVYTALTVPGALPFSNVRGLVALVATSGVTYTLPTLLVATIIALATRQPPLLVYRDSYRMVRWVHFITLPLGAILATLWYIDRWLLIPGVIPLIMAQRSFKALAAWQTESWRNKALASKLERLQDTATAMIASFEPEPLLKTVSTRLAALLDAAASWVVLLDGTPRIVAAQGVPPSLSWDAAAYAAELHQGVRQLDAQAIARLHDTSEVPWQTLVIIPLALENQVLGGICLATEHPITLAEDDRRVLLAFAAQAALVMEHARLFEELRHKQDELVRSSKLAALGTFAAGIAHEFNNLLAGILGYAQLGLASDDLAEKDEALEVAVRSCLRGRSITSGLLAFARRSDPQRGMHQIRDAVEDMLTLVERELAKVNIYIERRFQPVPPTVCDPGQIAQVVLNLVTNARDAMIEKGGGVITVALAQRDGQIELTVSDTGSGIPEHLVTQVFEPFMTTKGALGGSAIPGTGLGLAISYGIIQSHGGTITVESEVGRGTVVTVRVPIVNDHTLELATSSPSSPPISLRILVVEDEEIVADSIRRLLENQGHQVRLTSDGAEALRCYREQPFDLVLSDIVMPGMSGADLLQRLRAIDSHAQVVIMTGQAMQQQVDQLLRAGASGVITKPFVADELLAAIARGARARLLHAA